MKRDEMDSMVDFIIGPNGSRVDVNSQILGLTRDQFFELVALARLGASVAAPSEEEIEAMAKAIYEHPAFGKEDPEIRAGKTKPKWVNGVWGNSLKQDEARAFARAALSALKDRANV